VGAATVLLWRTGACSAKLGRLCAGTAALGSLRGSCRRLAACYHGRNGRYQNRLLIAEEGREGRRERRRTSLLSMRRVSCLYPHLHERTHAVLTCGAFARGCNWRGTCYSVARRRPHFCARCAFAPLCYLRTLKKAGVTAGCMRAGLVRISAAPAGGWLSAVAEGLLSAPCE